MSAPRTNVAKSALVARLGAVERQVETLAQNIHALDHALGFIMETIPVKKIPKGSKFDLKPPEPVKMSLRDAYQQHVDAEIEAVRARISDGEPEADRGKTDPH